MGCSFQFLAPLLFGVLVVTPSVVGEVSQGACPWGLGACMGNTAFCKFDDSQFSHSSYVSSTARGRFLQSQSGWKYTSGDTNPLWNFLFPVENTTIIGFKISGLVKFKVQIQPYNMTTDYPYLNSDGSLVEPGNGTFWTINSVTDVFTYIHPAPLQTRIFRVRPAVGTSFSEMRVELLRPCFWMEDFYGDFASPPLGVVSGWTRTSDGAIFAGTYNLPETTPWTIGPADSVVTFQNITSPEGARVFQVKAVNYFEALMINFTELYWETRSPINVSAYDKLAISFQAMHKANVIDTLNLIYQVDSRPEVTLQLNSNITYNVVGTLNTSEFASGDNLRIRLSISPGAAINTKIDVLFDTIEVHAVNLDCKTLGTIRNGTQCTPCNGVTLYQDVLNQRSCKTVSACGAGSYEAAPPSSFANRNCSSCILGFSFSNTTNAKSCMNATVCGAGYELTKNSTLTSDRVCTICGSNTFKKNPGIDSNCVAVSTCQAGFYISKDYTATSDRVCLSCNSSQYQDQSNQNNCKSYTSCPRGSYISTNGTATSDRSCLVCSSSFSTTIDSFSCTPWQTCDSGSYVFTQPSSTSDRSCRSCTAGVTYQPTPNQDTCLNITTCSPGSYVSAPYTLKVDRNCSLCNDLTFSTSQNAGSCSPWLVCDAGKYVSKTPTSSSDRTCGDCILGQNFQNLTNQAFCMNISDCGPGYFILSNASTTTDRQCSGCPSETFQAGLNMFACGSWQNCSAGNYISFSGSTSVDRACSACQNNTYQPSANQGFCLNTTICVAGVQYETGAPTPIMDRNCSPCKTACPAGEYLEFVCKTTFDSVCKTCGPTCATCSGPATCDSCPTERYLLAPNTSLSYCTDDCGDGRFKFDGANSIRECRGCFSDCRLCVGGTSSNCTVCFNHANGNSVFPPAHTTDAFLTLNPGSFSEGSCGSCLVTQFGSEVSGECQDLAVCDYGFEYDTRVPTPTTDRVCGNLTICLSGSYVAVASTPSSDRVCMPCPAGTVDSDGNPFTACDICSNSPGFYIAAGQAVACASALTPCVSGEIDHDSNSSTPCSSSACSPGGYLPAQSFGACSKYFCQAGTVDEDSLLSTPCVNCSAGKYVPVGSFGACSNFECPAGWIDDDSKPSTPCINCDSGTYVPSGMFGACSGFKCAAGTIDSDRNSSTPCFQCSAGVYVQAGNSGSCSNFACPSDSTDQDFRPDTPCVACKSGFQVSANKTGPCISCPLGTIDHDSNPATSCVSCPAGTYVPSESFGDCAKFSCAAGTVDADLNAATPCSTCINGTSFQNENGKTSCKTCSATCESYEYILSDCLVQSDLMCHNCTACAGAIASPCGNYTDTVCASASSSSSPVVLVGAAAGGFIVILLLVLLLWLFVFRKKNASRNSVKPRNSLQMQELENFTLAGPTVVESNNLTSQSNLMLNTDGVDVRSLYSTVPRKGPESHPLKGQGPASSNPATLYASVGDEDERTVGVNLPEGLYSEVKKSPNQAHKGTLRNEPPNLYSNGGSLQLETDPVPSNVDNLYSKVSKTSPQKNQPGLLAAENQYQNVNGKSPLPVHKFGGDRPRSSTSLHLYQNSKDPIYQAVDEDRQDPMTTVDEPDIVEESNYAALTFKIPASARKIHGERPPETIYSSIDLLATENLRVSDPAPPVPSSPRPSPKLADRTKHLSNDEDA